MLDAMFSNEPGPWDSDRVPYAREWMDSGSERHVRRVTIVASTQVGKTESLNNVLGYFVHQQPSPAMLVLPRRDDARLASERRILPMVRTSPALAAELTDKRHDAKAREIAFRRSVLYLRAAQSPADLASVPVRVVCGDEIDKWPRWTGKEANPLSLVMERTRTFYDHLVMLTSTPTTRDGLIWQEFEGGDRRRFYVPCPHCGAWQVLRFGQVKWPKDIDTEREMRDRREAWYECEECRERIDDRQKRAAVELGRWVPEGRELEDWRQVVEAGEDDVDHRSYHIWAGYSPWVAWWKVAAEFLRSRDDPARMMNFVNSWLAEVWEERVEETSDASVAACIDSDRASWDCPEDVKVVTAAVDVQKDRLEWAVVGWGDHEESWVIAAGKTKDWGELAGILTTQTYGPNDLRVRCAFIDSRFRQDEVVDFARQHRPVVHMIAGVDRQTPVPFGTQRIDKHPRTGQPLPNGMQVWTVNVWQFKDMVAARLARSVSEPERRGGRIHLPNDLEADWLKQVASEQKVRERRGSKVRSVWILKPGHRRNEAWDLLVYNAAAARLIRADLLGTDRMRAPPRGGPPRRARRGDRRPPSGGFFPFSGGR